MLASRSTNPVDESKDNPAGADVKTPPPVPVKVTDADPDPLMQ